MSDATVYQHSMLVQIFKLNLYLDIKLYSDASDVDKHLNRKMLCKSIASFVITVNGTVNMFSDTFVVK